MKTVKITAQPALLKDGSKNPRAGQVFTQSVDATGKPKLDKNGKEHGFIRVESRELNLGFAYEKASKVRSTLIAMTKEAYIADADLMKNGTVLPGQIIRQDSLTPWFNGQEPLQAPKRDKDGNVIEGEFNIITSNGMPVYRNEVYTTQQDAFDAKLDVYDTIKEGVAQAATSTKLA